MKMVIHFNYLICLLIYGVPKRESIYFICIRKDIYKNQDVNLIHPEIDISDIVFEDY